MFSVYLYKLLVQNTSYYSILSDSTKNGPDVGLQEPGKNDQVPPGYGVEHTWH